MTSFQVHIESEKTSAFLLTVQRSSPFLSREYIDCTFKSSTLDTSLQKNCISACINSNFPRKL